jgi:biotin carboxyl carrier protein
MASMSRRLFRTTVDGRALLVEVDGATARIRAEDERAPSPSPAPASAATGSPHEPARFIIEPFDNGQASTVTSARVRVEDASVARHVHTAVDNGITWIFVDGEVFRVEVDDADRGARARPGAGDEALAAPMPATVIKLLVEPGQIVERGDSLLLLEAMKMELPIRAPRAGRVSAFHCKAGELVQAGVPLVILDAL